MAPETEKLWLVELRRPWVRRAVTFAVATRQEARRRALGCLAHDPTFHLARVFPPGAGRNGAVVTIKVRDLALDGGEADGARE